MIYLLFITLLKKEKEDDDSPSFSIITIKIDMENLKAFIAKIT